MHYNAARIRFHHRHVYQRGAYSHFIDHFSFIVLILFCNILYGGFIKDVIWGRGMGITFGRVWVGSDKMTSFEFSLSRLWQLWTWVHIMYAGFPELTDAQFVLVDEVQNWEYPLRM